MKHLYRTFPRQIGIPYRINAPDEATFYNLINKHNGKRRVFSSLYNYTNGIADKQLLVDKIWFDLDSSNSYTNLLKFHDWALNKNYQHLMIFSGGGFHVYLMTKDYENLENPKFALRSAHQSIAAELGMTIGQSDNADIDEHIVGDVARVVTVPNTYNVKRRKYCIPINEKDLAEGIEHIRRKAMKQEFEFTWYGKDKISMTEFDGALSYGTIEELNVDVKERIDDDVDLQRLPPCIAAKFLANYVSFRERFHIHSWMRDMGYSLLQTRAIVKKYWSKINGGPNAANLADYIIKQRQIEQVYARENVLAANCETLQFEGMCVKKHCKWRNKLYL